MSKKRTILADDGTWRRGGGTNAARIMPADNPGLHPRFHTLNPSAWIEPPYQPQPTQTVPPLWTRPIITV